MSVPFTHRLREALETLAGLRGPRAQHGVRWKDLDPVNKTAFTAQRLAERVRTATDDITDSIDNELTPTITALLDEADRLGDELLSVEYISQQVRNDHNALVQGFLGENLASAFGAVEHDLTLQEIRQVETSQAVATVHENVLWTLEKFSTTQSTLTDAGIYVDPADGTVKIAAVEYAENRISETEIRLDAAESSINLRATKAYVDQQIAQAVIDPSQIPVFDDLDLRLQNVEVDLDAAEAAINLKAEQTVVAGHGVRLGEAEVAIGGLEEAITLKVERTEFDDVETRVQTAETEIALLDGAGIRRTVADTRSIYEQLDLSSIGNLEELLGAYESREALARQIAYAQEDIHARVTDEGVAISEVTQKLGAAIEGNVALIETERSVRASENAARAEDIRQLDSRMEGAENSISGQASAFNGLQTEVEDIDGRVTATAQELTQVAAGLSDAQENITGNADALTAITTRVTNAEGNVSTQAEQITELNTSITSVEKSTSAFHTVLDIADPAQVGSAVSASTGTAALGQSGTVRIYENNTARRTSAKTNGYIVPIPTDAALQFVSRRIKISVLARAYSANPSIRFSVAYDTSDTGNSGILSADRNLSNSFQWYSFFYDVPNPNVGGPSYLGIFPDNNKTSKAIEVARVQIEVASEAAELPEISSLQGDITGIHALDANSLDGTIFGAMLDQLNVAGNGKIAGIDNFGTAMADLHGNASASYVMRARAGGAAGELEVVAWDDATGTGSAIYLSADYIFAKGTFNAELLSAGSNANMLENTDLAEGIDARIVTGGSSTVAGQTSLSLRSPSYSFTDLVRPSLQLYQNGTSTSGYYDVSYRWLDADGSRFIEVEPNASYEFSAYVYGLRCSGSLYLQWLDANGAPISAPSADFSTGIGSSTDPRSWRRPFIIAKAPANAAFVRPIIRKYGTQSSTSSYLFIDKPMLAETHAAATEPRNYQPKGISYLDGQRLVTDSVTSRTIAANAIKAVHADFESLYALGLTVGNADIVGSIESDNFVPGVQGWRIRPTGDAEFNYVTIRRRLVVDEGYMSLPASIGGGNTGSHQVRYTAYIETNTPASAWVAPETTYMAAVGRRPGSNNGTIYAETSNVSNNPSLINWGFDASVLPITRWSGNQRLWIKVDFIMQRVERAENFQIEWKLYEVT